MKRTLGTRLSDAHYRATRSLRTVTGRMGNYRRRRFAETGKGFAFERATRGLRSSLPVYRDRINPATGRPRRDDAEMYRHRDAAFSRMRERKAAPSPAVRAQEYAPRERADAVLGLGRSARAREALRQARVDPWEDRKPHGRTR